MADKILVTTLVTSMAYTDLLPGYFPLCFTTSLCIHLGSLASLIICRDLGIVILAGYLSFLSIPKPVMSIGFLCNVSGLEDFQGSRYPEASPDWNESFQFKQGMHTDDHGRYETEFHKNSLRDTEITRHTVTSPKWSLGNRKIIVLLLSSLLGITFASESGRTTESSVSAIILVGQDLNGLSNFIWYSTYPLLSCMVVGC